MSRSEDCLELCHAFPIALAENSQGTLPTTFASSYSPVAGKSKLEYDLSVFPLRDDNSTIHSSLATFFIIGLNASAWIFLQNLGANPGQARSVCNFGFISAEFLNRIVHGTAIPLGNNLSCVIEAGGGLVYAPDLHVYAGGWLHILFNMWFLFLFGDNVEGAMGPFRFIVFYIFCGLGVVAVQLAANPSSAIPMVGASGAIGGVMGGYAMLYPRVPVYMLLFFGFFVTRIIVSAYFMLGYRFLLQVVSAIPTLGRATGGVAFWVHERIFGKAAPKWKCRGCPVRVIVWIRFHHTW